MKTQNSIKHKLSQPDSIIIIQQLLVDNTEASRSAIAESVCHHFEFYNTQGKPQKAGCLKALRELERSQPFQLPDGRSSTAATSPKRLQEAVPPPVKVHSTAGQIKGLELVRVETDSDIRCWNELMIQEHPRGAGPFVGAQIRYLIGSEHGWLGGLGFSASALQLKDREQWIGWDPKTRRQHLHRVINMSRFLIRPSVECHNLASMVLGMSLRQLADDFELRYHYRPWLIESFVDSTQHDGICYQAANWIKVGKTQGRGRQDSKHQHAETIKDIYVYPLEAHFRDLMGVELPEPVVLEITEGLEGGQWAENEMGGAELGDGRLSKRLVESSRIQAQKPTDSFSGAAKGDEASVKGYYRMIDQPDDSAVTPDAILAPHRERTVQRMRGQQSVLCIQDGTDLNYNSLAQCEGLGVIGANQTGAQTRGLHLHSTLVTTTDGIPLGLLGAQCNAPTVKADSNKKGKEKKKTPSQAIEDKKTFCWIESVRDSNALARELPTTRQICVMDREADFYELFCEKRHTNVELLVRAKHNRNTLGEDKLFETLRQSDVQATLNIQIPRQSERPKLSGQKARQHRPTRTAEVSLRYREVGFPAPSKLPGKEDHTLRVIHLREENPPEGQKRLEWFLLTTMDIDDQQMAEHCIRWYRLRWRIEDWHRVLKSGCGIENMAYRTAERLKRGIAIKMVIAWRIMLMTLLGRECPGLPAGVLFSDVEIKVLSAQAVKKKETSPHRLVKPSCL